MFRRLAHEAFHAYLETYVYPRQAYDVPRWLNEGLAQTFEAGLLEDADVLHDGGKGHAVRAGKIGHGGFAEHEGSEDGTAGGIGKGAKGGIEGCGILNHMV